MNLKAFAMFFGIAFIAAGILGFIPKIAPQGELFGLFMVNGIHNSIHIVSGIVALITAAKESYAKIYFKIFGIIYGIVAILGFVLKGNLILMHVNMYDNVLHSVIAAIALYLGFAFKAKK